MELSTDISSHPLDTFPLFTRLPPELRLNIWELNLPSTRLIPVHCGADMSGPLASDVEKDGRCRRSYATGCTTSAPLPVNLHVCSESRAHALFRYQLSLGFARTAGRVYLRPDTDVLYFGPAASSSLSPSSPPSSDYSSWMAAGAQFHTCMALSDPTQLAQVRRIAVDDALFRPGGPGDDGAYSSMMAVSLTTECLRQIRARMPRIEDIIFVPRASVADPARARANLALQVYTAFRDLQSGVNPLHTISPVNANDGYEAWSPPKITILAHPVTDGTISTTENDRALPEWPAVW